MVTKKHTSLEGKPFVKDTGGNPDNRQFSYGDVVEMLLYLVGNKHTNIDFYVNCCDWYMFALNNFYYLSLKFFGYYLKATTKKGLFLNPSLLICKIYCFSDYDFNEIYGHGNTTNTPCVKSRTEYAITFFDCLVLCQ